MSTKIIADCCNAHEGERFLMGKMIEEASRIGASYIKFQLFDADKLDKKWENYEESYEHYKKCQLDYKDMAFIVEHSIKNKILPLFTTFDIEQAIKLRHRVGDKSVKIASPDCNNRKLLDYCVRNFDEVFVSTGMHHGHEIQRMLKVYGHFIIPLYCRSLYPVKKYTEKDYQAMEYLQEEYGEWGLSDHAGNIEESLNVIDILSPDYIERHFTLEKTGKKDDCVSSTPDEMARLTNYPFPELSEEEIKNRKYITRWTNE